MGSPVLRPSVLTEAERAELTALASRRSTAQALRARIILACATGGQNKVVAARLGLDRQRVGKWRQRFHLTPTSASWLNQVERFFAALTDKKIRRGAHRSVAQLTADIAAFIALHNAEPKPFR